MLRKVRVLNYFNSFAFYKKSLDNIEVNNILPRANSPLFLIYILEKNVPRTLISMANSEKNENIFLPYNFPSTWTIYPFKTYLSRKVCAF